MEYLWTQDLTPPEYPPLQGKVDTDVLVIGGGMAGILCARALRERGVECLLLEAETIGSGVTSGTTAVLSAQHDTLYSDIMEKFGAYKARLYLEANLRAVEKYRELAQTIPCDFEDKPSIMYDTADGSVLEREAKAVNLLGFPAEFTKEIPLPVQVKGAVRYPRMAQFHPLKFLYGAAEGLTIREHSRVLKVKDMYAYTDGGCVEAKKIVVATHYPIINRRGMYFMKLSQTRSYAVALENAPDYRGTYVETSGMGMYFRNYGDLLIVGGGDHRVGVKGGGLAAVRDFVQRELPQAREKYAWAAQDCMSLDGIPYVGQYSPATPDIYVVSGFNEWGMTSSMAASEILADEITGGKSKYAPIFAPQRPILRKNLFVNMGTTLVDFVTPTPKRCPHMGCALKWNPQEKSWDCPCHGSRFAEDGSILDDPATHGLKCQVRAGEDE